jgi:hypothetical protein
MKKVLFSFLILMALAPLAHSQVKLNIDVIIGNRQPAPNEQQMMRAEENRHPNIAKAMHDIEMSMRALHDAPDDFGGRKAQAEADLKQAWISLRKALYFRIYEDSHR